MCSEGLALDLRAERIVHASFERMRVHGIRECYFLQCKEMIGPEHQIGISSRIHRSANTGVVCKGVAIESKECLVRFPFELIPFRLDISHLHINAALVEAESGDVAITIDWDIVGVGWNEWVAHDAVEGPIDFFGYGTEDHQVADFAFEAAG
jgi:hypothetical protein